MRHNEIRNITANMMREVCPDMGIEPTLQPVTGEHFQHRTVNCEEGARLDVVAQNSWSKDIDRVHYFDVRVFNPYAPSYRNSTLAQCYRKNELEKKRSYKEQVWEIEHGSFTPFSIARGTSPATTIVYTKD